MSSKIIFVTLIIEKTWSCFLNLLPTIAVFDRKKNVTFLKIAWKIAKTGFFQKLKKKVNFDKKVLKSQYNRRFSGKSSFFDVFAHNASKNSVKKIEIKGSTLEVFCDFGTFWGFGRFLFVFQYKRFWLSISICFVT